MLISAANTANKKALQSKLVQDFERITSIWAERDILPSVPFEAEQAAGPGILLNPRVSSG
ncbi:hypothetical protein GCM10007989_12590 [Devosia pacifica]|uniref:Uncharacterized protein n=1 Tax=Devosia pacifica TaxID=1335967 RepID=A0A918S182_9HYPH|nr:hypothetical protein GCM10007989_12590 [Devosia pacifica]